MPDRGQIFRQGRQTPELHAHILGVVKIGATRGEQIPASGQLGETALLIAPVRRADDLDAATPSRRELIDESLHGPGVETISGRVRNHRHAAGADDPADGVTKCRPAMRDVTRLALDQEAAEDFTGVPAYAPLDQKARKVRAREHRGIAGVAQRAFPGTRDARVRQRPGNAPCAFLASSTRRRQPVHERAICGIDMQAENVHRFIAPADRNLYAGDKSDAQTSGFHARFGDAAKLIMVGECKQAHAVLDGATHHGRRCQRAVGNAGMAVQVSIDQTYGHAPKNTLKTTRRPVPARARPETRR